MFKLLGIIIGSIFGNFGGGFIGFIIGAFIDSYRNNQRMKESAINREKFIQTLLILTSAVAKSDNGNLLRSELSFIKNYLIRTFGPDRAQAALYELREILNQEYDIPTVCHQFARQSSINEQLVIIHFLFGLASSDGEFSNKEMETIRNISDWIGLSRNDFEAVKAMFFGNYHHNNSGYSSSSSSGYYNRNQGYSTQAYSLENDYKILEISSTATDDEVKKAYRRQAMKHHPDKVNHLGEDIRKAAEEKFAQLNEAYERIKRSRGMN